MAAWARLRAADRATLLGLPRATMPHQCTGSRVFGHAGDVAQLEPVLGQFFADQQATAEVPERGSSVSQNALNETASSVMLLIPH